MTAMMNCELNKNKRDKRLLKNLNRKQKKNDYYYLIRDIPNEIINCFLNWNLYFVDNELTKEKRSFLDYLFL